jgi:hypothetical protein
MNFDNFNSLDWEKYSRKFHLSEDFIELYKDKVNWTMISSYQKLSESFIRKHELLVDWESISLN